MTSLSLTCQRLLSAGPDPRALPSSSHGARAGQSTSGPFPGRHHCRCQRGSDLPEVLATACYSRASGEGLRLAPAVPSPAPEGLGKGTTFFPWILLPMPAKPTWFQAASCTGSPLEHLEGQVCIYFYDSLKSTCLPTTSKLHGVRESFDLGSPLAPLVPISEPGRQQVLNISAE